MGQIGQRQVRISSLWHNRRQKLVLVLCAVSFSALLFRPAEEHGVNEAATKNMVAGWQGGAPVGDGEDTVDSYHLYNHVPKSTDPRDVLLKKYPLYPCNGTMVSGQDERFENGRHPEYKERNPKFLCNLHTIKSPCVIYSFGSWDEISFEVGMDAILKCDLHVFDPSKLPDKETAVKHHFTTHSWGISAKNIGENMKTLGTIMRQLGHDYVDVLKMDVEGAEEEALPEMKSLLSEKVGQIAMEFHSVEWMSIGMDILQEAGFQMVFARREDRCGDCTEVTMVHPLFGSDH